jgi:hypothetical protein
VTGHVESIEKFEINTLFWPRPLERPKHGWMNKRIDLKEVRCDGVDRIQDKC